MHRFISILILLLISFISDMAYASDEYDGSKTWIERPWEFRYFLKINEMKDMEWHKKRWFERLAKLETDSYQNIEGIFPYAEVAKLQSNPYADPDPWAALLIEFDESGAVRTSNTGPAGLKGRMNRLFDLIIAAGGTPRDWSFSLGHWYTGRSDEDLAFAPAICTERDMAVFTPGRYQKNYAPGPVDGNFGCREWGYYLQSDRFPYIDITSYEWEEDEDKPKNKKGQHPKKLVAHVRATIGWGRFDVAPKPVIGKAIDTWTCYHECPDGEAPGIIPDIKAWTAKRGWPLPKPPKKQPMFPDREYQRGEFID